MYYFLRWVGDDPLLNIIGSTCPHLESLDVWRSSAVSDLGIKMLLSSDDLESGGISKVCKSLLRLGVKETSVTHLGCLIAIIRCKRLEVLNFSHTAIVKDFFNEVRNLFCSDERRTASASFSLKSLFFPVANGNHFQDVIKAFPKLEDLRLWTSVPQIR